MSEPEIELTQDEIALKILEEMEQRVRRGLGPEEGLVDLVKEGYEVEQFLTTPGGRALVRSTMREISRQLKRMCKDPETLTPERAFRDVLALTSQIGILRSISGIVAVGRNAGAQMAALEEELDAGE